MKFLASLLIVCIVLLSAFAGSVKPLQLAEKTDCCAKADKNAHCPKTPEKKHQEDNCEKYGCNMMLTCSICGFLVIEPVRVNAALGTLVEKAVPTYQYGNSAVYFAKDWKPPKV
jgi:hypothetical protein